MLVSKRKREKRGTLVPTDGSKTSASISPPIAPDYLTGKLDSRKEDSDAQSETEPHHQFVPHDHRVVECGPRIGDGHVPLARHDQHRNGHGQQGPHADRYLVGTINGSGHHQPTHPGEDQAEDQELRYVDL